MNRSRDCANCSKLLNRGKPIVHLTRLNHRPLVVNAELIKYIEATPREAEFSLQLFDPPHLAWLASAQSPAIQSRLQLGVKFLFLPRIRRKLNVALRTPLGRSSANQAEALPTADLSSASRIITGLLKHSQCIRG